MSVIRIIHNRENPFVQLNKRALWDENLSLKAIGLWARCMSRPDDWRFNIKELASKSKEGRKAIDSAINELIENNYAVRLEHWEQEEDGRFSDKGVEYAFFEFPATEEDKEKVLEEFKKSYRHCRFGNLRKGDLRDGNLLIKKETEKEEGDNIEVAVPPKPEKTREVLFFHGPHVKLSAKDYSELVDKYGIEAIRSVIDRLNDWMDAKGRSPYKDYAAAIRNWMRKDNEWQNKTQKPQNESPKYNPTSSGPDTPGLVLEDSSYLESILGVSLTG